LTPERIELETSRRNTLSSHKSIKTIIYIKKWRERCAWMNLDQKMILNQLSSLNEKRLIIVKIFFACIDLFTFTLNM